MRKSVLPLLLLLITQAVKSDTTVQTDWSGGPGEIGPDIQFGNEFYSASGVDWFNSIGDLSLSSSNMYIIEGNLDTPSSVYAADLDGDGDKDVIATGYMDDVLVWWENVDGAGTAWIEHLISYPFDGAACVCSDDMNGDGDMDVISGAHWDDEVNLWLNEDGSGTSWTTVNVGSGFNLVEFVSTGDINGDGYPDILGASWLSSIAWWENMDGAGMAWTKHLIGTSVPQALCIQSADFDGDGDEDVLVCSRGLYGGVRWWENISGTGASWQQHDVDLAFGIPEEVFPIDVNGDGDCDIVGVSLNEDLAWWENLDGLGGSWEKRFIDQTLTGPGSVYPADLDQDGDYDVIVSDDTHVLWWENSDGSGQSWIEHTLTTESGDCRSLFAEDVNGDGAADVLAAGFDSNDIYWFEVTDYPPVGELESSILYLGNDPGWGDIGWNATLPAGTAISLLVRASDDYNSMGTWSDTLHSPGSLSGILDDYDSFFQYKAILESTLSDTHTPALHEVFLSWTPVSIADNLEPVFQKTELIGVHPNPVSGVPTVHFCLAGSSTSVAISILDISGRSITTATGVEFNAGRNSVQIDQLPPGVYFCRMKAGSFTDTQRFVVIE